MGLLDAFHTLISGDRTQDAARQLEGDIDTSQRLVRVLKDMLLFQASHEPNIDVNTLFASAPNTKASTIPTLKTYCTFYVVTAQKRAQEALIFAEAFESREKSIGPFLEIYDDLRKRQGNLTQALQDKISKTSKKNEIIEKWLEKIPDHDKKVDLSTKYHHAMNPVLAIITENDALIADITKTLEPAVEAVRRLKKEIPEVRNYETAAKEVLDYVDAAKSNIQKATSETDLQKIMLELNKKVQCLIQLQDKLRQWRDAIVPAIAQAEIFLKRDKEIIKQIRSQYGDMQNAAIAVIKEVREYMYQEGLKQKASVSLIEKKMLDAEKQIMILKEITLTLKKAIEKESDTLLKEALENIPNVPNSIPTDHLLDKFIFTFSKGNESVLNLVTNQIKPQVERAIKNKITDTRVYELYNYQKILTSLAYQLGTTIRTFHFCTYKGMLCSIKDFKKPYNDLIKDLEYCLNGLHHELSRSRPHILQIIKKI